MVEDVATGFAEALLGLLATLLEAFLLLCALMVQAVILLLRWLLRLMGIKWSIGFPGWIESRQGAATENARRQAVVIGVLLMAGVIVFLGLRYGRTEIRFSHSGFGRPYALAVQLTNGKERKLVTVEKGTLHVLRGYWVEASVIDPRYHPAKFQLVGHRIDVPLEKNQSLSADVFDATVDKVSDVLRQALEKKSGETKAPSE